MELPLNVCPVIRPGFEEVVCPDRVVS